MITNRPDEDDSVDEEDPADPALVVFETFENLKSEVLRLRQQAEKHRAIVASTVKELKEKELALKEEEERLEAEGLLVSETGGSGADILRRNAEKEAEAEQRRREKRKESGQKPKPTRSLRPRRTPMTENRPRSTDSIDTPQTEDQDEQQEEEQEEEQNDTSEDELDGANKYNKETLLNSMKIIQSEPKSRLRLENHVDDRWVKAANKILNQRGVPDDACYFLLHWPDSSGGISYLFRRLCAMCAMNVRDNMRDKDCFEIIVHRRGASSLGIWAVSTRGLRDLKAVIAIAEQNPMLQRYGKDLPKLPSTNNNAENDALLQYAYEMGLTPLGSIIDPNKYTISQLWHLWRAVVQLCSIEAGENYSSDACEAASEAVKECLEQMGINGVE